MNIAFKTYPFVDQFSSVQFYFTKNFGQFITCYLLTKKQKKSDKEEIH